MFLSLAVVAVDLEPVVSIVRLDFWFFGIFFGLPHLFPGLIL